MEIFQEIDRQLFLALNGCWSAFSDQCWILITNKLFWIPLYVFLAILMIKKVGKKVWLFFLITTLMILTSDQGANFAKRNVQRLRPCHQPEMKAQVHTPDGCGGKYGYFSGHASNSAAISTMIILLFPGNTTVMILMICYALLVGLSRIFLGAHYPADILSGFIWGSLMGYVFYRVYYFFYALWLSKK